VPIDIVVELLRLLGAAVHEGELNRADAIGRYVERLRAERGGPQGQGRGQDEEEQEARKAEEAEGSEKGGGREGRSLQRLRLRKGGREREGAPKPSLWIKGASVYAAGEPVRQPARLVVGTLRLPTDRYTQPIPQANFKHAVKYLFGELSKSGAVKEVSDLGLVKNTGKRKCAGGWGEGEMKKHKRYGSGGDGVPIEMVELLRLMGLRWTRGSWRRRTASGATWKGCVWSAAGAKGKGQCEREGSEDDYSDHDRGREREGERLKHKEKTWSNRITFIYFPCGVCVYVYACSSDCSSFDSRPCGCRVFRLKYFSFVRCGNSLGKSRVIRRWLISLNAFTDHPGFSICGDNPKYIRPIQSLRVPFWDRFCIPQIEKGVWTIDIDNFNSDSHQQPDENGQAQEHAGGRQQHCQVRAL
jgi:hypothetical protein